MRLKVKRRAEVKCRDWSAKFYSGANLGKDSTIGMNTK